MPSTPPALDSSNYTKVLSDAPCKTHEPAGMNASGAPVKNPLLVFDSHKSLTKSSLPPLAPKPKKAEQQKSYGR